jgi:hypothetical protein
MSSPGPSRTSYDGNKRYPSLHQACAQENQRRQQSEAPSQQSQGLIPTRNQVIANEPFSHPSSLVLFDSSDESSDCEAPGPVLAPQILQMQQAILPHLPAPSTTDNNSSQHRQKSSSTRKGKSKQLVNGERKIPLNKCPEAGTEAAHMRTLAASLARCKTKEKMFDVLARRNLTLAQYEEMKQKEDEDKKNCPRRARISKRRLNEKTPDDTAGSRGQAQPPPYDDQEHYDKMQMLFSHEKFPNWVDKNVLRIQSAQIRQYYTGARRPHMILVIARYNQFHELELRRHEQHYLCLMAAKCPLNGNEALSLLHNVLSWISQDKEAVESELAEGIPFIGWKFPCLASILGEALNNVMSLPLEIFSGAKLDFKEEGIFSLPIVPKLR